MTAITGPITSGHTHGRRADGCATPEATTPPTDGYFYGAMSFGEATTPERER